MNYGGFWIRFIAYSVDSLILAIGLLGIAILLALMGLKLAGQEFIFLVVVLLYFAVLQSSARQATFGKALVGLKVTDTNGGRISFLRSLARTAATVVSTFTFYIGYIIAAFTGRKQALHDMIAGTLVVREKPGRVGLALAVVVLGPLVVAGVLFTFAGAILAGMMGGMAMEMMGAQKQAATQAMKPVPQAPKPAAPAPTAAAKPTPAAPAPTAAAKPAPAAPAAAPAAPAKPAVAAAPAPVTKAPEAPVAMVVTEAAKPAAKERAVQAPKEEAKAEAKEEAVVMTTGPGAVDVTPKAEAAPATAPAPVLIPKSMLGGPTVPGPKFNDLTTAVLYRDAATVNELISFGKWPDRVDGNGTTPLMLAVALGDAPIAEALLKAGANASRAMPVAREKKNAAMISLLERHGGR